MKAGPRHASVIMRRAKARLGQRRVYSKGARCAFSFARRGFQTPLKSLKKTNAKFQLLAFFNYFPWDCRKIMQMS